MDGLKRKEVRGDALHESVIPVEAESWLLRNLKRFNRALHLLLGSGLVIAAVMIIGLFLYDVYLAFTSRALATSLLHALSSLIILWTVSELLNAEIQYLASGELELGVFIDVAIAASLRKILISTAEQVDPTRDAVFLGMLLILGIVRWLVSRPRQ